MTIIRRTGNEGNIKTYGLQGNMLANIEKVFIIGKE